MQRKRQLQRFQSTRATSNAPITPTAVPRAVADETPQKLASCPADLTEQQAPTKPQQQSPSGIILDLVFDAVLEKVAIQNQPLDIRDVQDLFAELALTAIDSWNEMGAFEIRDDTIYALVAVTTLKRNCGPIWAEWEDGPS